MTENGGVRPLCEKVFTQYTNLVCKLVIPPASTKLKGGVLVSPPSVRPSVRPSVCPSVCGQNNARSVTFTILAESISYLHILLSNFRRCVVCNGFCKILKFELLAFCFVILTSSCFDLGSDMNQYYGESWGGEGYSLNAGILVVLVG